MPVRRLFPSAASVPLAVVLAVLATHGALKALFFHRGYLAAVAYPVEVATRGLVSPVLLAGLISWALLVFGAMRWGAGLRLRHVGLSRGALADALPVLLALWLCAQAASVVLGWATGSVALGGAGVAGLPELVGRRLQAVLGSGLIEEVIYRGFLLVQLYALVRQRRRREEAVLWAVVGSSLYFGLNHFPAAMRMGLSPVEAGGYLVQCALVGALLGALYLRTGNLFIAAGAHVLLNDPVPVFATPVDPSLIVLIGVSVLLLAWPYLSRRIGRVFTTGMVEGVPAI